MVSCVASPTPSAGALIAVSMLMEYLTNGFFGDVEQRLLAQRPPQCHQRPRRRLVLFSIGLPLHFGQDQRLRLSRVRRLAPSSRGDQQRR